MPIAKKNILDFDFMEFIRYNIFRLGDLGILEPPLLIPNRVVKQNSADDTVAQLGDGKLGNCQGIFDIIDSNADLI